MPKGFSNVPCIKCGETNVQVSLADVGSFCCPDCEEEFTVEDVQNVLDRWQPVLKWLATAPDVTTE